MSQKEFADRYGIPEATLQDWEQHRRKPDAATRSYLRLRRVALQMSMRVW
jgi:putative transcriptional regulator